MKTTTAALAALLLPGTFLAACSPRPAEAPVAASSAQAPDFSYDLDFAFTPEALAKMKARGEKVTVAAKYYGLPKDARLANPWGTIEFDTDTVEIDPNDQTVHMTAKGVPLDRLDQIIGPAPLVHISAHSTRDGKPTDTIACRVFKDYVRTAQEKPLKMPCRLKDA